jgi:hypothetical protein
MWMFTLVYGPTISSKRNQFWNELSDIRNISDVAWLVRGEFNVIRSRS